MANTTTTPSAGLDKNLNWTGFMADPEFRKWAETKYPSRGGPDMMGGSWVSSGPEAWQQVYTEYLQSEGTPAPVPGAPVPTTPTTPAPRTVPQPPAVSPPQTPVPSWSGYPATTPTTTTPISTVPIPGVTASPAATPPSPIAPAATDWWSSIQNIGKAGTAKPATATAAPANLAGGMADTANPFKTIGGPEELTDIMGNPIIKRKKNPAYRPKTYAY